MAMDLDTAIEIVFDLARQNIIDEAEAQQDPEVLLPARQKQIEACNTFEDFVVNQLGDD